MKDRFQELTDLIDQQDRSSFGAWAAWDFVNGLVEQVYGVGVQGALERLEQPPLQIKVIVEDGIVQEVLKNKGTPVEVEVVDVDTDREDWDALVAYRDALYADETLMPCDHSVSDFTDDAPSVENGKPLWDQETNPVSVYAVSPGGVKEKIYSGDLDECKRFCEDNNWIYKDENDFVWDLEMEDSRDDLLPEDYFMALDYYSDQVGRDIENEFVRTHAEELVYCYHNEKEFNAFDYWTHYENLLGEKISFEEFAAIDYDCPKYATEIEPNDLETIGALRESLAEFRGRDPHLFTCLGDKQFMFLVKAVSQEDAEKTGQAWYKKVFFEPGCFDCWNFKQEDFERLSTDDVIESKAYQKLAKEKVSSLCSLADNIQVAEAQKKAPANCVSAEDLGER